MPMHTSLWTHDGEIKNAVTNHLRLSDLSQVGSVIDGDTIKLADINSNYKAIQQRY